MIFGEMYPMHPKVLPVDMPRAQRSSLAPDALREDALILGISRDGTLYLLNTRICLPICRNRLARVCRPREGEPFT